MRRGILVVLAGWFVLSLGLSLAISDEPKQFVQQLPDRPDLRRERADKKTNVFRLLPTWRTSETDPRQEMKAQKSQPFRLLTMRDVTDAEPCETIEVRPSSKNRPDTESQIYQSLQKRISVDFRDVPLADALKRLASRTDVNFFVDPRGLEDAGVPADAKVTLTAHGVRHCTLLDQILSPLHLDYLIAHEVIKVTGRQQARGEMTTRTYAIAGLVPPLEDGRTAPDRVVVDAWLTKLQEEICPDTWELVGGPASVAFYATTMSIVVRQSADVHEELSLYLNSLATDDSSPAENADED